MLTGVETHADALQREMDWLEQTVAFRMRQFFEPEAEQSKPPVPPELHIDSALAQLLARHELNSGERLVLALALAPHLRPQALDPFFVQNSKLERGFSQFGGSSARRHAGFLPSGETAAFLLAGDDLASRIQVMQLFDPEHAFACDGILQLDGDDEAEPLLSAPLRVSIEALQRVQTGMWHKPDYNARFPAKRIESALSWEDLVLMPEVMDEIELIRAWLREGEALMLGWGLNRVVKPGYRCLFYGPPGTGKTLTATLLGMNAGLDVYRIDLSMVVSKYIGETEKNLARVFDQAQNRRWILFFDEADALFGKRTATQTSNDRHANQEVAYLLQRIEDFPGVVVLASNLRGNLDEAFSRRFQSMIYFPLPDAAQRLRLWRSMLKKEKLADDVDLQDLADRHPLSGGAMVNVLRFAALQAAREGAARLTAEHLRLGVARELRKEGRTL